MMNFAAFSSLQRCRVTLPVCHQ